jgi:hypothetical protein
MIELSVSNLVHGPNIGASAHESQRSVASFVFLRNAWSVSVQ